MQIFGFLCSVNEQEHEGNKVSKHLFATKIKLSRKKYVYLTKNMLT